VRADRPDSDRHALLLLSQIYCHYLLITPDDEFFDPQVNPLLVDEVLDLSLVWRNLAFWGYMNGVSGAVVGPAARASQSRAGAEEDRSLFTRGVTRVSERK
jgi:ubiquitin-protein ligase E3 C